jgi:Arc/MetJ-type ribon-helix-helix transcriptional regulator
MRRKLLKIGTEGVWLPVLEQSLFVLTCRLALPLPSLVVRTCRRCNNYFMKSLTVRLPEPVAADIEAESRGRKISKSDVVREWLERAPGQRRRTASLTAIADLIGSVEGLPSDLTARKKEYLHAKGYGQKRPR